MTSRILSFIFLPNQKTQAMRYMLLLIISCGFFWAQAQKTYFIETERPTQEIEIDGTKWDKEAFFTVDPSDGYHQVIVKEIGYKNELDILKNGVHTVFSTEQKIMVDTSILSIVKPIELNIEDAEKRTYEIDYTSYMKDMEYSGELSTIYSESSNKTKILSAIDVKNQYLINELNVYHNMTIGRYKFFAIANVKDIKIYEVVIDKDTKFLHVAVNTEWSITRKNMDNLPVYSYDGKSGKILFSPESKSYGSAVNTAIHDAIFSSLLSFLAEQEGRIKRNL